MGNDLTGAEIFIGAAAQQAPGGMSVAFALCTAIWNGLVVPIENGTGALSTALQGWMHTQYPAWIGAYLLIMMLIAAWRADEGAFLQTLRLAFLASILYALCSNAEAFNYWITGAAHGTVASIANAIAAAFGGGAQITAGTFDILATKAFAIGSKVFAIIPWYSPKGLILCLPVIIYWVISEAAIMIMFAVWMIAYVITDVILAFGPLFIGIYAFPFLRPTSVGWFRVVLSGMLTQIMLVGTLVIFLKVLLTTLGAVVGMTGTPDAAIANVTGTPVAGEGDIAGSIYVLIFSAAACFLFLFVVWEIVKLARGIAGAPAALVPNWSRMGAGAASAGRAAGRAAGAISPIGQEAHSASPRQYAFQRTVGGP